MTMRISKARESSVKRKRNNILYRVEPTNIGRSENVQNGGAREDDELTELFLFEEDHFIDERMLQDMMFMSMSMSMGMGSNNSRQIGGADVESLLVDKATAVAEKDKLSDKPSDRLINDGEDILNSIRNKLGVVDVEAKQVGTDFSELIKFMEGEASTEAPSYEGTSNSTSYTTGAATSSASSWSTSMATEEATTGLGTTGIVLIAMAVGLVVLIVGLEGYWKMKANQRQEAAANAAANGGDDIETPMIS